MYHLLLLRFADMYKEELREEVELADRLNGWTNSSADDIPCATDAMKQLKDRLRALKTWSSANMQGRWFSLYDSAKNSLLHWTGLLCAMTYRLMKVCDLGFVPSSSNNVPASSVLGKSRMDEGILRTALGLLANSDIRRSVMTYVVTMSTFRCRAGMRTKNSYPPGVKGAHVPLPPGPAVTVARVSCLAAGDYIEELNETLNSIERGDLTIDPAMYNTRTNREKLARKDDLGCNTPCHYAHNPHEMFSKVPFVQPGQFLADHILYRLRSGAIYSFGTYSYAALLHPSANIAARRYEVLKKRATKIKDIMNDDANATAIPSAIKKSLVKLCRDDVYMDFATRIMPTESVQCCRAPYQDPMAQNCFTNNVPCKVDEDAMDVDVDVGTTENERHVEYNMNNDIHATQQWKREPMCDESCSCQVFDRSMGKIGLEIFGAINGTKWLVENAFNKIRAASKACSRTKRGKAEMTREAMFVSQYSNTLIGCRTTKNVPLRLDLMDWSDATLAEGSEEGVTRADFTCQHMRGCKALYNSIFELLGWNSTMAKKNPDFHQFASTPPNGMLSCAIAEEFITTVPKSMWRHAYKSDLIPAFSVLYNVELDEYRFILGGKKESLVPSWPCVPTVDNSLSPPRVIFNLCESDEKEPEELFIFPLIDTSMYTEDIESVPGVYKWKAVRIHTVGGPVDGEDIVGTPLSIAVSLVPSNEEPVMVAMPDGAIIEDNIGAQQLELPHSHILDYVPLVDWSIENGLPGCTEAKAKQFLAEVLTEKELRAMVTPHGNHDGLKSRLRKKVNDMKYMEVFEQLMVEMCPTKSENWRASALAK